MPTTRFAPSPTGFLHLGYAYAALFAARAAGNGKFLLRIEDIDPVRCKPVFTDALLEDLNWLGLRWEEPVRVQSRHRSEYAAALDALREQGVLYPCFCTRRDVIAAAQASGYAPHSDDAVFIYPGTCRDLSPNQCADRMARHESYQWRLDSAAAQKSTGELFWHDRGKGRVRATPEIFGDVVLARKDVAASYHLCVTLDDHLQNIDLVTRGEDLFSSTHIHRLLQALLGLYTPDYHHHELIRDEAGRRYAKRDTSATLRTLRQQEKTATDIRAMCRFT